MIYNKPLKDIEFEELISEIITTANRVDNTSESNYLMLERIVF